MVGEGFSALRDMELAGCKDARRMGLTFGEGLSGALKDIAGDCSGADLDRIFEELTAAVYIMDAIDDLDDDYMDGTYNPFLPESGFINSESFINSNLYRLTSVVGETVGSLQEHYSRIRPSLRGNQTLCDNIVYYGIPESAKKVITGEAKAKASIKNVLSNRKERTSDRARRIVELAYVQIIHLIAGERAFPVRI